MKIPYKRILVTGGAGFIGATIARMLNSLGHEVVILDNLSAGRQEYLEGVEHTFYNKDIRDLASMQSCFEGVDAVIHLAAFGNVVDSVEDPLMNLQMNVLGTVNVLEAAKNAGVNKLAFASTGGAIMGNTPPPVNESCLPKPISPYGASKLACEGYCNAYAESYAMATVCCRFANVYGPYSGHKKGVITKYINAFRSNLPVTIYGDGSSERDYIHVNDLAKGILLALAKDTGKSNIFHIATDSGTTINELALMLADVAGVEASIEYKKERQGEVDKNFASYDKANSELGFKPEIKLENGLKLTYDWYASNIQLIENI